MYLYSSNNSQKKILFTQIKKSKHNDNTLILSPPVGQDIIRF